jgi:hypothetical protein
MDYKSYRPFPEKKKIKLREVMDWNKKHDNIQEKMIVCETYIRIENLKIFD